MINKPILEKLYKKQNKSMQEIASLLGCSVHKVQYWMERYGILARSISDAIYLKNNPNGDPFKFRNPKSFDESKLFGMGIGLYWGEGTKANKDSIRLGNTDPELLEKFIQFLITFFSIKRSDLRFGLQIFTDISAKDALDFWSKKLRINNSQFYKPIISKSVSVGTYRKKAQFGVLTVLYHNIKARDLLISLLPM